jgi:hypothetical protein
VIYYKSRWIRRWIYGGGGREGERESGREGERGEICTILVRKEEIMQEA